MQWENSRQKEIRCTKYKLKNLKICKELNKFQYRWWGKWDRKKDLEERENYYKGLPLGEGKERELGKIRVGD